MNELDAARIAKARYIVCVDCGFDLDSRNVVQTDNYDGAREYTPDDFKVTCSKCAASNWADN